ncbi:hypothetical protein [Leptolyngbya iicbica]|uniref:Transketolase n=2 Tax=Cyanophyceae TaxID=3028117 RepID=A0A4Q7EHF2_9CYAN|nr:hypothetical protein [Leptolyngbya sp. LK]RZM82448.1 hypothetical protein DYY88_04180 [Leptolyngbya sp. LK]
MPRVFPSCLLLAATWLGSTAMAPAIAHEVQFAEDVGATLHIEPNDIARAGAPTDIWFALTQAGGTVVPLAECDCTLTLYDSQANAIETPPLSAISAEGFQAIPGATVTFPEVGAYELRLAGSPQQAGAFTPFELSFEVTVASRAPNASAAPTTAAATSDEPGPSETITTDPEPEVSQTTETLTDPAASNQWLVPAIGGGIVIVVGLAIAIIRGGRSPRGEE